MERPARLGDEALLMFEGYNRFTYVAKTPILSVTIESRKFFKLFEKADESLINDMIQQC